MKPMNIKSLALAMSVSLTLGLAACNPFTGSDDDGDGNEVRVTVEAVGADHLDADDGFRYEVDADTEYENLGGLADVAVGDVVDIEFEETASADIRRALEIEAPGGPDDDD